MKYNSLDKKIGKILDEEETFLLSLILLAQLHEDDKYKNISELIFLFDNYKGFKQFIKYYEGTSINVPSVKEIKQALRLLTLFQKVKIDKMDINKAYNDLNLSDLNLSIDYCKIEIDKFYKYLQKNGTVTLKQLKRLSKSL